MSFNGVRSVVFLDIIDCTFYIVKCVSGKMSDQVSVENFENLKSVYLYWNVCVAWHWGFDGAVKQLSLTGRHGLPTHVERCSKLGGSLVVRVPPLLSRHRLESALPPPASIWRRVPWFGRGGAWNRGVQWRTDSGCGGGPRCMTAVQTSFWSPFFFLFNPPWRMILFLINFQNNQNHFSQLVTFTSEHAGPRLCNSGWRKKKKIHGENMAFITGDMSSLW